MADPIAQLLQYPFMRSAFAAGTAVAVLTGVMGWFVVLRGQTFAGHTLSQVGFPGAAGAVLFGLPQLLGLAVLCTAAALGIASLGRAAGGDRRDAAAAIGTVQAFALALGLLFASLYRGLLNGVDGILFGAFLGITPAQAVALAAIAAAALCALAAIGRPLFYLSVDPDAAASAGVPVRALSVAFLLLLALAVAAATVITGALLTFALLVMPAAAAQRLTARPAAAVALAVALGLAIVWLSLAAAYFTDAPLGFLVTSLGFGAYLGARGAGRALAA